MTEVLLDDVVGGAILLVVVAWFAPAWTLWTLLAVLLWLAAKAFVFRSHLRRPAIGVEAMRGRIATALEDLAPRGQVRFEGEIWEAELAQPGRDALIRAGERVKVEAVEGLTLRVAPVGLIGGKVVEPRPRSLLLGLARAFRREDREGGAR